MRQPSMRDEASLKKSLQALSFVNGTGSFFAMFGLIGIGTIGTGGSAIRDIQDMLSIALLISFPAAFLISLILANWFELWRAGVIVGLIPPAIIGVLYLTR